MEDESKALEYREAELDAEAQELALATARLADNEAEFRSQHEDLEVSLNQSRDHIAFAIRRKNELTRLDKTLGAFLGEHGCMFDPSTLLPADENDEVAELRKGVAETSTKVQ